MNILVTGASGFLGSYLINSLKTSEHHIIAVVRSNSNLIIQNSFLKVVHAELLEKDSLNDALKEIDVVIHCAAAMVGDYQFQYDNTVLATKNLLSSMQVCNVKRIILIGSYSVYDYQAIEQNSTLTEDSTLKQAALTIGTYAKTKLLQEDCVKQSELDYTILRCGIIVDKPLPWVSQIGIKVSKLLILLGKNGEVPQLSLSNCPSIIEATINSPSTVSKTYNLVDDTLLERMDYAKSFAETSQENFTLVSLPYNVVLFFIFLMQPIVYIMRLLKLSAPQIVNLESFYERAKPLKHTNLLFKKDTGWASLESTSKK